MAIRVRIPGTLGRFTNNQSLVEASGKTVIDVIENLDKNYPGFKKGVCDEEGDFRKFINIYLNMEDIRYLDRKKTIVKDGDEITLVMAIAGG